MKNNSLITLLSGFCSIFFIFSRSDYNFDRQSCTDDDSCYAVAVADAQDAKADEISNDLIAITTSNTKDLSWEADEDGEMRVLVVVWSNWTGYAESEGNYMTLTRDVWVTIPFELQNFCQNLDLTGDNLELRLEQVLGLPPSSEYDNFAQLWVLPTDIFRPCPDPEIDDNSCDLVFPDDVSESHIEWYNNNVDTSYTEDGYPWTRLGYTYDWANQETDIGLSEFIVKSGASVKVESTLSTDEYCE